MARRVNVCRYGQEADLLRQIFTHSLLVIASIAAALLLLEAVIRIGGNTDADGQFAFMGYALEPYALPVNQLRAGVEGYIANKEISVVIYDEKLGWSFRPNSARQAGTFTLNSGGFRARRDYEQVPPPNTLRIALFGDSFTAGDDVGDDEVWSHQLELLLEEAGIRAEVLNFGVGAYGMDQAYLRWMEHGKGYSPDIVIFGLQPENLARNLNVFRQLMHGSGPPFSKPRFILNNNELELINSPTLPPEQLIAAFEDFSGHPLAPYEHHYASRYAASNWWAKSRVASLLFSALKRDVEDVNIYGHDTEGGQLGKAIIDAFASDAAGQNARFVAVHLPLQRHLQHYYHASPPRQPPYQFLLDHCRNNLSYIAMEEHIDAGYIDDRFWTETKHYGPALHALVAEAVAGEISDCVLTGACNIARFESPAAFLSQAFAAGS